MVGGSRLMLVIAVAVGLWIPLTHVDWFHAHEQSTYIVRTLEWAGELRTGHLYPRWAPDLYGGYGCPLFVFYAPTLYAVTGLLSATFLDPFVALKLFLLVSSVLSGVGVYVLIRGETRDPDAALLGAVVYLAAPYRIGDLYDRGDLAEFSCLALLPLVLALYLASAREARPFRSRALAGGAALVHGVMIVTHTILGLWGTVVVGIVVGLRILVLLRHGVWRRGLPLVCGLVCAPGLAGAYIVPAMAYRSITHATAMVVGFYKPKNQWIALDVLFDSRSELFGRNFMRIGPIVVVAALVTLLAVALNFKRAWSALAWLVLSLALIGLTLPGAVAFWEPGRIPLAQFIQFPWRLLGPATLCACIALGMAAAAAMARWREGLRNTIAIGGGAAFLLLLAWPYVSADPMPRNQIATDADSIRLSLDSTTAADEFLPLAVAAPPKKARDELVAGREGARVAYATSDGSRHALSVVSSKPNAFVVLALYGFPGWEVSTVSGPSPAKLETDPEGLVRVRLPAVGVYQLRVAYAAPPAANLGLLVTLLSLLALGLMLLRGTRFWPSPLPPRLPALAAGSSAS